MAKSNRFKICYIGGGSRFVVTLLHGLAAQAEAIKALGRPIEVALYDVDTRRAGDMARYAEIVARQTGLPLTTTVTDDRDQALRDANWVLFSAGIWQPVVDARERYLKPLGDVHGESGPAVIVESAALWPYLRNLAQDMKRLAPKAIFSTLVNPTDVMAAAFQQAFGIPAIGICVEVGGLKGWLAYNLEVDDRQINLEHVGVNHIGWVSRWTVNGQDGPAMLAAKICDRMQRDDWYPHCNEFVWTFQATGHIRSSPYHHWPIQGVWDDERQRRNDLWNRTCRPEGKGEYRQMMLGKALAEGTMIPEVDPARVHPEATPYTYPNTRWMLGALAVGLAGGSAGPVPLQVRNGQSNRYLPAQAWIEVPTMIEKGKVKPQAVPPLPEWLFNQTRTIALQRVEFVNWLAGQDPKGLSNGLLAMPNLAPLGKLLQLANDLPELVK